MIQQEQRPAKEDKFKLHSVQIIYKQYEENREAVQEVGGKRQLQSEVDSRRRRSSREIQREEETGRQTRKRQEKRIAKQARKGEPDSQKAEKIRLEL